MMRALVFLAFLAWAGVAGADPYYNSAESGCNGSDTTVLLCDDFEDQVWYRSDVDTPTGGAGYTLAINDGWGGNIFSTINPADAILCGAGVTPFGNCAANSGLGEAHAWHYLKTSGCGSTGAQQCDAGNDIYVRTYINWPTGHGFGIDQEKSLNITNNDADIRWANLQLNCGGGGSGTTATASVSLQVIHAINGFCAGAGITVQTNHWYFVEIHIRKNTANGAANGWAQLWMDDCGIAGTSCTGSPTLRVDRQNVDYTPPERTIETVWFEYWSNQSTGPGPLWDQLKVSTNGPIGFASLGGGGEPPPTIGTKRLSPTINLRRGS